MAGILIRMKLALLRRSMSGLRAAQMVLGAVAGLALAAGTLYIGGLELPLLSGDLLALLFGLWMLGWIFGPILFGGGENDLRPEHFSLYPISPRKLATGLLAAGTIGVPPFVTLVAFTALVVYAADLTSPIALVVAVPGVLLQLAVVVLLSRVLASVRGQVVRSQLGAALSGLLTGALMAASSSIWALSPVIGQALADGFSTEFSTIVRALPSGWAVTAVDAVNRADWALAAITLGGLLVLDLLLVWIWGRLLTREVTGRRTDTRPVSTRRSLITVITRGTTPFGAVVAKELRTWSRDVTRTHYVYFALFYGLLLAVIPLLAGVPDLLPWTGLIVVAWTAAVGANLYGSDGTALWMTLVTPRGERADVRGRQYAWLAIVAPMALVLCVVFTAVSGLDWAWPWALGLTAAVLGGAAGVIALVSVAMLVPMSDPHRRGGGAWENGIDFFQVIAVLVLVAVSGLPTYGVLRLGSELGLPVLVWSGVPVGIGTGALFTWLFGLVAQRRLASHGADLLHLMRSGHRSRAGSRPPAGADGRVPAAPSWPQAVVVACFVLCWLPIFPQGLVPMFLKLTGDPTRSWFLALWLPEPLQWPMIITMIMFGLAILGAGWYVARKYDVTFEARKRREAVARSSSGD